MGSQFDIAVGLTHQTLDKGTTQLYQDPTAREKLFKGSDSIKSDDQTTLYTVNYDVKQAPNFVLAAPDANTWKQSVDDTGKNPASPTPPANSIQVVFPQFYGKYTTSLSTTPHEGTAEVIAIVSLSMQGNTLNLTPVSVWLDESQMKGWDKYGLNQVIKMALQMVEQMMQGLSIKPLSLVDGSIDLTDPILSLNQGVLVMAASLKAKGSVDVSGFTWPTQDLFVLLSPDVLKIGTDKIAQKIVGFEKKDSGKKSIVYSWDYDFTVTRADVTPVPDDLTKVRATIGYTFNGEVKPLGIGGPCSITTASKAF
jgi:hypothetical protein